MGLSYHGITGVLMQGRDLLLGMQAGLLGSQQCHQDTALATTAALS